MERNPDIIRGRRTIKAMKFPWKETPILYGEDARRFEEEMKRVDNMSKEERRANAEALRKRVDEVCKEWNVTIKI